MADALETQQRSKSGFIRSYGMFWDAAEVDWRGEETRPHKELLGRIGQRNPRLQVANFWKQRGIYVLYNDHGPYYVGKTVGGGMTLGKRLSQHYLGLHGSPHRGKLTRFSWFGWHGTLKSTDERGLQNLRALPKKLLTDSTHTVHDIESLLICTLGTIHVGNAREEAFTAAARWEQIWHHERDHYLTKVESRLYA